jgi:hypothetical protein
MFAGADSLNSRLDHWNMSAVTDTSYMFYKASSFNQALNNWNMSAVTNTSSMFMRATSFTHLNKWNLSRGMYGITQSNVRLLKNIPEGHLLSPLAQVLADRDNRRRDGKASLLETMKVCGLAFCCTPVTAMLMLYFHAVLLTESYFETMFQFYDPITVLKQQSLRFLIMPWLIISIGACMFNSDDISTTDWTILYCCALIVTVLLPVYYQVGKQSAFQMTSCREGLLLPPFSEKSRCNFDRIWTTFWILVKFTQNCALVIEPPRSTIYPSNAPVHGFEAVLLGGSTMNYISSFWLILCVVVLWECMANILIHAQWTKDYRYFLALPFSAQIVDALSSGLYILIIQQLVFWVDCSVKNNSLRIDTLSLTDASQATDAHQMYGMTALFLLVCYILSASALVVLFHETLAVNVRFCKTFVILERLLQLIVVLVSTFSPAPGLTASVNMIVFGVLAYQCLLRIKPVNQNYYCACERHICTALQVCNVDFLCTLLGVCYALCFWFSLMAWVATISPNRRYTWFPYCILVAGSLLITCFFYLGSCLSQAKLCWKPNEVEQVVNTTNSTGNSLTSRTSGYTTSETASNQKNQEKQAQSPVSFLFLTSLETGIESIRHSIVTVCLA